MADQLLTELNGDGVLIATFNRPEQMNALSAEIGAALHKTLARASSDPDVRSLLITGKGRAFCAGAEVTAGRDPSRDSGGRRRRTSLSTPTRSRVPGAWR